MIKQDQTLKLLTQSLKVSFNPCTNNNPISFSVQGIPLSASPFTINNQSGEIFTVADLDYEQYPNYTIIIRVEDNGTPKKLVQFNFVDHFFYFPFFSFFL